jgi:imidazoleglycerol phosphate dehydratase HisB
MAPPKEPRKAERRRATKETTIEVRVDLDGAWSFADEPTGGPSVWTGKTMTPARLRASVQKTSRIATGIEVLVGIHPIVTLEKQLPNMIGTLV